MAIAAMSAAVSSPVPETLATMAFVARTESGVSPPTMTMIVHTTAGRQEASQSLEIISEFPLN